MTRSSPQQQRASRFRRVTLEILESRQMMAADWRNPVDALDVNNDRRVTAFDALEIINELNLNGVHALTSPKPATAAFIDTTGNNQISAFDALGVINFLNRSSASNYSLVERAGKIVSEETVTVTAGNVTAGTRIYQLKLEPQFDTSHAGAAAEDIYSVYLFDPNTGNTVIDAGTLGSSLFSLNATGGTTKNGLVTWDGSLLSIDLSAVTQETLELRLQLLSTDQDSGSRVIATPWTNTLDPAGTPRTPGPLRGAPTNPGGSLDVSSFGHRSGLSLEIENVAYQRSTGRYTAEIRLLNGTFGTLTNGVVKVPGLVTGTSAANASGTDEGVPYWNFDSVIAPTGLAVGEASGWLKVELHVPDSKSLIFRPEPRALSKAQVFSGSFTTTGQVQTYEIQAESPGRLLVLGEKLTQSISWLRVLDPAGIEIKRVYVPATSAIVVDTTSSGTYQLQLTSEGVGDFSFGIYDIAQAGPLTLGVVESGTFDSDARSLIYAYYGTADTSVFFKSLVPAWRPGAWRMISAGDSYFATAVSFSDVGTEYEIPHSGWYYFVYTAPSTTTGEVTYDFFARVPVSTSHSLALNTISETDFASPGDRGIFAFAATLDQHIIYDDLTLSWYLNQAWLVSPSGIETQIYDNSPFILNESGNWKLVVRKHEAGSLKLRVLNVADLPLLDDGIVIQGTLQGPETHYYRVPGIQGQRFSLEPNFQQDVAANMTGPAAKHVNRNDDAPDRYFQLSETGTNVLQLRLNGLVSIATYAYTGRRAFDAPVTHSGFGIEYVGNLAPDAIVTAKFTASAGTQVLIDSLLGIDNFLDPVTYPEYTLIYTEAGLNEVVFSEYWEIGKTVITLTKSGEFTVVARNALTSTAAYGFRILDLTNVPVLTDNIDLSDAVRRNRNSVYRVEGQVHKRFVVNSPYGVGASGAFTAEMRTANRRAEWFFLGNLFSIEANQTYYLILEGKGSLPAFISFEGTFID
ncbi:dockerin type I domain-containing protein [Anatilimnocola sp. NA78]|uniref:dockerin type I domain-containing protein n=1 Tax=Anatilimnocola sp. NA78 TaxID=3415683 RepID=UPI003CE4D516